MVRDAAFLARTEEFEGGKKKALAFGCLLVTVIVAGLLLSSKPAHAATFEVDSTADTDTRACTTVASDCTLRGAINAANAAPGADHIGFDMPGEGVQTIAPLSSLPEITGPVTIDGYTQHGSSPNTNAQVEQGSNARPLVELNGGGTVSAGLLIRGGNSTVRGLVLNRFKDYGLIIASNDNAIEGNFVGTDAAGTADLGNRVGVYIVSSLNRAASTNNTVGGASPAARNVISGNDVIGVRIANGGGVSANSKLEGNYIGTDKTGAADLGNSFDGVSVDHAPGSTVGGTSPGARNVISGNDGAGVLFMNAGVTGSKVEGNYVGTNAAGIADLGNSRGGVDLRQGSTGVTVGGTSPGSRNVISGNDEDGVVIQSGKKGNKVEGNYIGTDATGAADLGNFFNGVSIRLGSVGSAVGGAAPEAANTIAFNGLNGVYVSDVEGFGSSTANPILSNSIFSNGLLGIELAPPEGANPNDPQDPDAGPNALQNSPVLSSAKTSRKGTTVSGTLNSTPGKTFTVQFFSNPPEGADEGKTLIGEKIVTTGSDGKISFAFKPSQKVLKGQFVTATATDPDGNTSEFSAPKKVVRVRR